MKNKYSSSSSDQSSFDQKSFEKFRKRNNKTNLNDLIFEKDIQPVKEYNREDFAFVNDEVYKIIDEGISNYKGIFRYDVQQVIERKLSRKNEYFLNIFINSIKNHFNTHEIKLDSKDCGASYGVKATLNKNNQKKTYYIKGSGFPEFDSTNKLDELFVYKLLEKIGYGAKVDFILTGLPDQILICSNDLSNDTHRKNKQPQIKQNIFKTIAEQQDKGLENKDLGNVSIHKESIVFLINFLQLYDVFDNAGNIGTKESITDKIKEKMYIIDFGCDFERIQILKQTELVNRSLNKNIIRWEDYDVNLEDFDLKTAQNSFVKQIMDKRKEGDYLDAVNRIINGRNGKLPLEQAIAEAFIDVKELYHTKLLKQNEKDIKINKENGSNKDFCSFPKDKYDLELTERNASKLIEVAREIKNRLSKEIQR